MKQGGEHKAHTSAAIQVAAELEPGINRQIIARIRDHEVYMDVRKARGGDDAAPTPPEYLVASIGGCIINTIGIMAGEKNAALKNLRVSIDGLIDPSLAMGQDSDNRAGFIHLNATISMDSDLPADQQNRFIDEFGRRCPLCDTIMNETILQTCFLFRNDNMG